MIPQHRSTPRGGEREETERDRDREREMQRETTKTEKSRKVRKREEERRERKRRGIRQIHREKQQGSQRWGETRDGRGDRRRDGER